MKDGRTHLAHKAEHAVDLETGAIVSVTVQGADRGDTQTMVKTLTEAAEKVEQALPEGRGIEEVVADKGYHSTQRMVDLDAVGLRSYVSEPRRGKRRWRGDRQGQEAVYANRRRIRGERGQRLLRQRGERLERPCAHLYGSGGMRRLHVRGHENVLKRPLIQVSAFNLGMLMRLEELEIQAPPVPVAKLARSCGARIVRVSGNEDDIDGFLYREDGDVVIGVNQDQATVRKRFTIAHELGHLLLHEHSLVHVDSGFRVRLRSGQSNEGTDRDEMEANRFAAELLMPIEFLQADLEKQEFDLADDSQLRALAKRYGVSTQALAIRLNGLGYAPTVEI